MTMEPRILIMTAGYGEGHNAAARALATAFNEDAANTALVVDIFALSCPRLNSFVRRAYLAAINGTPRLWKHVYAWMDRPSFMTRGVRMLGAQSRMLAAVIERERPAAICSTFPAYAALLQGLSRDGRLRAPHFNVVTDSISINSIWWRPGCDGWFLPNEDSAEVMRAAGVDASRLHVTGFPVNPFFRKNEGIVSRPRLSDGAAPRVLYIVNSGTQNAKATARLLLAEEDWEVTCTVGREESLRRALSVAARRRRRQAEILGWTDQIPRLLMTHHVVISKAGGATTQEAIAARCPMIVNQVVPGQEEGNCELLLRHRAGALAATPESVVAVLRAAFSDRARAWEGWRSALEGLYRPDAARAIVARVLAHAGRGVGEPFAGLSAAAR
jgi:processive 1,2-diacylglycerol beta-glucosyltransferase